MCIKKVKTHQTWRALAAMLVMTLFFSISLQGQTYYLSAGGLFNARGNTNGASYDTGQLQFAGPLVTNFSYYSDSSNCWASVDASVSYGVIQVLAACSAISFDANDDNDFASFEGEGTNELAAFQDGLVIISATLPPGTPVQVRISTISTGLMNAQVPLTSGPSVSGNCDGLLRTIRGWGDSGVGDSPLIRYSEGFSDSDNSSMTNTNEQMIESWVGDSFGFLCQLTGNESAVPLGYTNAEIGITANMRLTTYVNVLTTGAGYVTYSGTKYPSLRLLTPYLSISLADPNTAVISWPRTDINYILQQNSDLSTPNWVMNTNTVNSVGGSNQVSVTRLSGNLFFRLIPQ